LILLKDHATSATRQRLAVALAAGDVETKRKLEDVVGAKQSGDARPLILSEPPVHIEVGASTTALSCEAVSLGGATLQYQWCKDSALLHRANRSRFVLCGAGPSDEGSYICQVSAGANVVSTQPCEVKLSGVEVARRAAEAAKTSRCESPLRRAANAEGQGHLDAAIGFVTEAIAAADGNDTAKANALCRRAELLFKLGRYQEAFRDGTDAVKDAPELARAHVARGSAAAKLGNLAEAVSSWETAELLGAPEAASEAASCRQRLREFFEARQAQRGAGGGGSEAREDPEEGWRKSGWGGRYAGGSAGGFFGGGSRGGGESGAYRGQASVSPELQRNLGVLGLAADSGGALPSEETVRQTYRRLALQAHPDKPGGSKTAFQELQNAYEAVLKAISG